jgi:hypothetical protein
MLYNGYREMDSYGVVTHSGAFVRVYLPKTHWAYLIWLKSQGVDLDLFTRACDQRRMTIDGGRVPLADFLEFATDRLAQLHRPRFEDRTNLVSPAFPHQLASAITKAEAYFRKSGPNAMRWHGWMGHPTT